MRQCGLLPENKMKIKKVEVITYYPKDDEDFSGDYSRVVIKINGKIVRQYGDAYHEKGDTRAESFLDGVGFVTSYPEPIYSDKHEK